MKTISIYTQNGHIRQVVSCPESMVQLQIKPGDSFIEGNYPDDMYYVRDGVAVPKGQPPHQYCVFDYDTYTWAQSADLATTDVRGKRELLLAQSDWTQMPDVSIETKAAWAEYRQALRDITAQSGYPFDVIWPNPPI